MSPAAGGRSETTPSSRRGTGSCIRPGGQSGPVAGDRVTRALRGVAEERRTPEDPVSLITNVVRGSAADRLLLLVHGFGADERDLGGLLPYLDPEGRFVTVLPRGPVSSPGMPGFAWYEFGLPPAERPAPFAAPPHRP